jgi:hypothetical protein
VVFNCVNQNGGHYGRYRYRYYNKYYKSYYKHSVRKATDTQ